MKFKKRKKKRKKAKAESAIIHLKNKYLVHIYKVK